MLTNEILLWLNGNQDERWNSGTAISMTHWGITKKDKNGNPCLKKAGVSQTVGIQTGLDQVEGLNQESSDRNNCEGSQ